MKNSFFVRSHTARDLLGTTSLVQSILARRSQRLACIPRL